MRSKYSDAFNKVSPKTIPMTDFTDEVVTSLTYTSSLDFQVRGYRYRLAWGSGEPAGVASGG